MPNIRQSTSFRSLDAQAATGKGNGVYVGDFRHVVIHLVTASSANLTVKVMGSASSSEPTWTSAASSTNHHTLMESYDSSDSSSAVTGATGHVWAGTDAARTIFVNSDGLKWLNLDVSARSAGNVTAYIVGFNNS